MPESATLTAAPSVTARLLAGFDDPAASPARWNALLASSDSGSNVVFLTWEWLSAWWATLGQAHGDRLLLLAAERDGVPLAFAPLYAARRMIYFLGSGSADYLDFVGDVSDPEVLDAILVTARAHTPGCVGFRFYAVLDSSPTGEHLQAAARRLGFACYQEGGVWPAPSVALRPADSALASTRKKSLLRHERAFERDGGLEVSHLRSGEAIRPHLDAFFQQHVERWAATPYPSVFEEPAQRAFVERLMRTAAESGWLRFMRLDWQGRPIAFHFGFCYADSYLWYKPSFAIDLARRSPGEVLLRRLLLTALDEGAGELDFGMGDEAFKLRFATHTRHLRSWALYPPKLATDDLSRALNATFKGPVEVLDREPNPYAASFASQIVSVQLPQGRPMRLFCKHGDDRGPADHAHKGGLAYEAQVYRHALRRYRLARPRLRGAHVEPETGRVWLFLDYLDRAVRLNRAPSQITALTQAAGWIGAFHAAHLDCALPLKLHDLAYFAEWPARTMRFAARRADTAWVTDVCRRYLDEVVPLLVAEPRTLIHGDYYADNVLLRDGQVHPIDWELSAISTGEIDLASLTYEWPADIAQACEAAYCAARWPDGAPEGFQATLAAARLYLQLRLLGEALDWPSSDKYAWRLETLRATATRLGWIA
jgi:CelD/BcsL family acetyltransferase involved in cellulose biosynthesis/aminoglycoside phosphotransferase (APT) family kinase protein